MSGGRCVGDYFLQTSADMCPADHGTVLPKDQDQSVHKAWATCPRAQKYLLRHLVCVI